MTEKEKKVYKGFLDITISVEGDSLLEFIKNLTSMTEDIAQEIKWEGEIIEVKVTGEDKAGRDITEILRTVMAEQKEEDDEEW